MTQVTDEMFAAATNSYATYKRKISDNFTFFTSKNHETGLRAALEAALAVRGPMSDAPELVKRLRARSGFFLDGSHWLMSNFSDTECTEAADLIEQQAKEIAVQQDKIADRDMLYAEAYKVIGTLTAERAELIEALRPFVYDLPHFGIRSDMDEVCRARALLERLGAKEVG